jgi:biopolymer transport protein TolQ
MTTVSSSLLHSVFADTNSWIYSIQESSLAGKLICVALVVLSCFSWAVMITKLRLVLKARKQAAQLEEAFRDCSNPLDLYNEGTHLTRTPHYGVYMTGAAELAYQVTGSAEIDENFHERLADSGRIKPTQMSAVENSMDRAVGDSVIKLESGMSILATAVSGAPFLGLLGTVWGVMDTFTGIASAAGAASLKSMAPGVSSALLTTVVGLLVAIPAMFGYNYLVNSIKGLIASMENFAAEAKGEFERYFLDYGGGETNSGHGNSSPASLAARRITASELFGSRGEQPSHRVVKRQDSAMPAMSATAPAPEFQFDGDEADLELLEN